MKSFSGCWVKLTWNQQSSTWLQEKTGSVLTTGPTCTVLADDHTQVDGGPVRVQGLAVGTRPVGSVGPDLLGHLVIRQSLSDWLLQRLHPVPLLPVRLCREAEEAEQRSAVRPGGRSPQQQHFVQNFVLMQITQIQIFADLRFQLYRDLSCAVTYYNLAEGDRVSVLSPYLETKDHKISDEHSVTQSDIKRLIPHIYVCLMKTWSYGEVVDVDWLFRSANSSECASAPPVAEPTVTSSSAWHRYDSLVSPSSTHLDLTLQRKVWGGCTWTSYTAWWGQSSCVFHLWWSLLERQSPSFQFRYRNTADRRQMLWLTPQTDPWLGGTSIPRLH